MSSIEKIMTFLMFCLLWYTLSQNYEDMLTMAQHIVETHTAIDKRLEACEVRYEQ